MEEEIDIFKILTSNKSDERYKCTHCGKRFEHPYIDISIYRCPYCYWVFRKDENENNDEEYMKRMGWIK